MGKMENNRDIAWIGNGLSATVGVHGTDKALPPTMASSWIKVVEACRGSRSIWFSKMALECTDKPNEVEVGGGETGTFRVSLGYEFCSRKESRTSPALFLSKRKDVHIHKGMGVCRHDLLDYLRSSNDFVDSLGFCLTSVLYLDLNPSPRWQWLGRSHGHRGACGGQNPRSLTQQRKRYEKMIMPKNGDDGKENGKGLAWVMAAELDGNGSKLRNL
ncbi:hypothetical protein METBIDRAFT_213914 [Metschnikowia bicuspidata var. bicuspidata NRRL YB-4993]|uniref:Uncharacterized protein n=1 Tax=Metschnikowia bicuspidata var. bicuspidata NRRL YB-4993 TaxID=869754 RepID=A0A1A0H692_9ASCO|nr:hypothetical protein METBIDRAFT_213914 [Metschnikowia bicuspidata var. bicuspidata NRRL YB-4993]OBA19433.1 hypothetical protein METBIDRAFT_213914 [Metschnikowia bicuspidata var. bicuspidata NRRL YB-4993]